MIIDLTKLMINIEDSIIIDENINIDIRYLNGTTIKRLEKVYFNGKITKSYDDNIVITGELSGIMILPDDITLEDTKYEFCTEIEENLEIFEKVLDIIPILWQNIVVEIPLKIVNEKNKDLKLKGNGWRLITEDESSSSKNLPFDNLKELLDERKE